ncbi:MAG: NAD-dependent epimerase/dehydratase family protein [Phycisphaerales bacterium]
MPWPDHLHNAYLNTQVLVTGGAGFIGSHLVDALVSLGARVRVIDDLSNGLASNLEQHARSAVDVVEASILDDAALKGAMAGCSHVFHQAALGSVPMSVERPADFHDVNTTGTLRVLEAAKAGGAVKRIVYAGSSSAYGDAAALPKREDMLPAPLSPYATSKLAGEYLMQSHAACYPIQTISLRYFNIFGPRQRPDSAYAAVIPAFAAALKANEQPLIFGDGEQTRDFTYVENAVFANLLAGASKHHLSGEVVNVAAGERYSLRELLSTMAELLQTEATFKSMPARTGDVQHSQADITRARELLGYHVRVSFRAGLRATLEGFS